MILDFNILYKEDDLYTICPNHIEHIKPRYPRRLVSCSVCKYSAYFDFDEDNNQYELKSVSIDIDKNRVYVYSNSHVICQTLIVIRSEICGKNTDIRIKKQLISFPRVADNKIYTDLVQQYNKIMLLY